MPLGRLRLRCLHRVPPGAGGIQRGANVMQQFGLLSTHFDVSSMIMPPSQFNFAPYGGTNS